MGMNLNADKLLRLTHRLDFFDAMNDHERFEVIQRLEANVAMHPKGATIIAPGGREQHLYIVLSGLVTIQKGELIHTVLNAIQPGDFFGEIAFSSKMSADVSVVANEDTILMALSNDDLESLNGLIRGKINDKIIFRLIKRLKHMNDLVMKMEKDKKH